MRKAEGRNEEAKDIMRQRKRGSEVEKAKRQEEETVRRKESKGDRERMKEGREGSVWHVIALI